MPPAVTWGQMANPGVPGGSGPVVKDNRNLQSASGGLQRSLEVSGGSSGSGTSGGGGGSGGNRNTGPSFEYSGRSSSPAKTTSNSSSAGGWGDMAKAGYGRTTGGGSGSSGGRSGSGSSGKTDKGGRRPIILDLGGDGFDVSFTGTARFDMDGDGFRERVGWADA
ncbi:MAG: hypothetical protein IOD05_01065 [Rhodobacter sp.]|nr:hypothetical protein [Rhodobacter sp.]MCA3495063.1 hypothetical protein [Rhodobacter sp.]MCA3501864.1 hypothetical protein [Rhodobacter sp.]